LEFTLQRAHQASAESGTLKRELQPPGRALATSSFLHRFLCAAACLLGLLGSHAAAEVTQQRPRIRNVYIPADQLKVLFGDAAQGVLMPRDKVMALWRKARSQAAAETAPPADAVLVGAVYEAHLDEHELRVTARLRIAVLRDTMQTVALPFGGLAIESARLDDQPAHLGLRDDGTLFLLLDGGLSQFSRHQDLASPNNPSAAKMGLSPSPTPPSPRRFDLHLEMSAPLAGKEGDLAATLRLPPAPGSELLLRLDEGKRLQLGETALLPESTENGRQTFRIAVGQTGLVPLVIADRLAGGNRAPLVFVHSRATGHIEPAGLGWQAVLDLDVYARATDTFELRLPESVDIAEIDAPQLRRWTLGEPAGGAVAVTLAFHKPVLGRRTVRISALASVPGMEEAAAAWNFPAVHVVDAAAHAGQVLVYASPTLRVEPGEPAGIRPARLAEVTAEAPREATGPPLAFTFWDEDYRLPLVVSPRRRAVQASIATLVDVHSAGLALRSSITAQSRHAPLFDVQVQLPREWQVASVQSAGEPVAWEVVSPAKNDAVEEDAAAQTPVQTLRIEPGRPAHGGDTLDVALTAELRPDGWFEEDEQPREVALPEVRLLEADEVEGTVLVQAPADIDLQVEDVSADLQPVFDPRSPGGGEGPGTSLQYRYEDAARVGGRLLVRRKPAAVSATTLAMVRLDRGRLDVHYQLDLHIRHGSIRQIGFTLPAAVGEKVHVAAVGWPGRVIEQRHRPLPGDGEDGAALNLWQIVLDRPVTGELTLALDFGQTFSAEGEAAVEAAAVPPADASGPPTTGAPVTVPVLAMQDVAAQTGIVAVEAAADQQIDCRPENLRELDPADVVQPAAYVPRQRIVAAYQYRGVPYRLTLAATRFAPAAMVDAICESAEIVSIAGRDGRTRHQAWFLVRGRQLQHVPVTLPDGAELWAVQLDGEPVEVRRQDGVYYVPVPTRQAGAAGDLRDLTLVYETGAPGPSGFHAGVRPRSVRYRAPELAMPTLQTTWHLAAPEGTDWVSTGGDYQTEAPSARPILATQLAESIARHGTSGFGWKFAGLVAVGIVVGVYSLVTSVKTWQTRAMEVLVVVVVLLILIALLLPSVQSAREAARRASCINKLKQIGLALHNFHDAFGRFPSAAIGPHNVPRDRQFSWLVALLPYMEMGRLFDELRLDLPWDHPHNLALLEQSEFNPFLCPSEVNATTAEGLPKTSYVAITGAVSAPGFRSTRGVIGFDGRLSAKEITDGLSNVLIVGEVTDGGPWFAAGAATARPIDDWIAKDSWSQHPGVANFLFADGAVRSVSDHANPDVLRALAVAQSGLGLTPDALDDPEWDMGPRAVPATAPPPTPAEPAPSDEPVAVRVPAPEAAPAPLPAPPRPDRARLSLRVGLRRPAEPMIRFRREGGPEELVVGLQDQTAARILQWLIVAAAVLAAWATRRAPGPRKAMAVVVGLALPIGLAGLVPVAWAPLLDGLLLGTLAAGTLWLVPPLVALLNRPSSAATTAAIVVALGAALAAGPAAAEQPPAAPVAAEAPAEAIPPPDLTLYVPYDPAEGKPLESPQVYLPHDEFLRLWKAAHPEQPEHVAPEVGAIISHAEYVGRLEDDAGRFDGRLLIHQTAGDWTPVALPLGDVALESIEIAGRPATLAKEAADAGQPAIYLKGRGPHVVDLRFSVPVSRLGETGRMTVPLRPVSAGRLLFRLPADDLEVQVTGGPGGWRRQRAVPGEAMPADDQPAATPGGEFVNIPLGPGGDVTLRWQPRRAEVREESPMTVDQTLLVEVLDCGLHLHGRFHYRVRQGAIGRLQLRVPPGVAVRRVDGPEVADWSLEADPDADADARRLVLALKRELATDVEVAIDAFSTLDAAGDADAADARPPVAVTGIEPLGAARETGRVAIRHSDHFRVRVDGTAGLEQIDRAGFDLPPRLEDGPALVAAYRYTARPWKLQLAVERQRPQIDVAARSAVTVAARQATLHSRLTASVVGAPVASLQVRLPAALRIAQVRVPPGADWLLQSDAGGQRLNVSLHEPVLGELEFEVSGSLPRDAEQPAFAVPGVTVENARTQRGELAVSLEDGLEAVLLDDGGARAVDPAALGESARPPAGRPVHYAFRYDAPPEGLRLRLAPAPSRVSADATTVVSVREGAVAYLGKVDFDIRGAGRSEFQLAAPAWLGDDVELRGERIRQVRSHADGPRRLWTVQLQEPAREAFSLQWFQSLPLPDEGAVAAAVVRPLGVERSQIHVALENLTADELAASTVEGATPVEPSAIPGDLDDSVRRRAVAAYRITGDDAELAWQRRVRPQEAGPAATVSLVTLTMVVHADGTYRGRAAYSVRNSTLQFLELQLPPDSRIWSVHVAREPVRPATVHREGRPVTLVPLQKTSAADFSATAVVVYSGHLGGPLGRSARIQPPAPEILNPVPVSRTLWTLHLPSEYDLSLDTRASNLEQIVAAHLREERRRSLLDELGSIVQVASKKTPSAARRKAQENLQEMGRALRTYADPYDPSTSDAAADVRRQAQQIEAEMKRLESLEADARPDRDPAHYFAPPPTLDEPPPVAPDPSDPDAGQPEADTDQPAPDAEQPEAARDLLRKKAAEQLERLQTMPDDAPLGAELPVPEATPPADPAARDAPPTGLGTGLWSAETDLAVAGTAYHFRKLHGDPRLVLRVRHHGLDRRLTAGIWAALCLALAAAVIHVLRRPNAPALAHRFWPYLAALLGAVWLFLLPLGFFGLVLLAVALCVLIARSRVQTAPP
jgi:prepilin-type processing-associated H-X9-DG protein